MPCNWRKVSNGQHAQPRRRHASARHGNHLSGLGPPKDGRVNLIPWVGAFILFAFLSIVWSQGPSQTLRRAAEALFVAVFALGVGAIYFDRKPEGSTELIRTMCWASSLLSFAVIVVSVAHGDFHIANPAWRLGRIGIENQIGWCASVGFLAAWVTRARKDIWTGKNTCGSTFGFRGWSRC